MHKAEISWKRTNEEGERIQVYAQRSGGDWTFFQRHRRYDRWEEQASAPLEDWLELLDGVRRRVPRRRYPPDEVERIEEAIRRRFPDAEF